MSRSNSINEDTSADEVKPTFIPYEKEQDLDNEEEKKKKFNLS